MFTVGQKVVSLKSWNGLPVKEGDIFPVTDKYMCPHWEAIAIGVFARNRHYGCMDCGFTYKTGSECFFDAKFFAPLEDYEAMNEFFNKATEPEHVGV